MLTIGDGVVNRNVKTTQPNVVLTYNQMMDVVERSDQMTTTYPTELKRKKETKKYQFIKSKL